MKILILGVTGMLGNTMFRFLSIYKNYDVVGIARNKKKADFFSEKLKDKIIFIDDINNTQKLENLFLYCKPDVVINCIGLIKQVKSALDPLKIITVNSLLPHKIYKACSLNNSRLIHFSTDCVFNGEKGFYNENDDCNARDLYGLSKYLGEVKEKRSITIRTSIIGHELDSQYGLVNWFLSQSKSIKGYKKAFFSGLPTIEIASIIKNYVIEDNKICGTFHVSGTRISKYELLQKIAKEYQKEILIEPDYSVIIDRSLNSSHFNKITKYRPPSWFQLIKNMKQFK